jgi:hypothetical protein
MISFWKRLRCAFTAGWWLLRNVRAARELLSGSIDGKRGPLIEFIDAQQAEIERLRIILRPFGEILPPNGELYFERCAAARGVVQASETLF